MTDNMLPILRQMHEADGDQERAKLLLACPDTILMKYASVFGEACARAQFEDGQDYILRRLTNMRAVRGPDGNLPRGLSHDFDELRTRFAAFAYAGEAVEL